VLHPHLYFVAFALAGAGLGTSLLLGVRRPAEPVSRAVALAAFWRVIGVPFALGFGAAGVASEALGASMWPDSLYHAVSLGALLAGFSLLAGLFRDRRIDAARAEHERPAPVGPAIEQRDAAGRDQHE
jgi:hypothetical protein